jgi:hypothetical protein
MFGGFFLAISGFPLVQTPKQRCNGVFTWRGADGASKTYLRVACRPAFSEWMTQVDESVRAWLRSNWSRLFGVEYDSANDDKYCACTYCNEDGAAIAKFTVGEGVRSPTLLFDGEGCAITVAEASEMARVGGAAACEASLVILLEGVWFAKERFGSRWRLVQAKLHAPRAQVPAAAPACDPSVFMFADDE